MQDRVDGSDRGSVYLEGTGTIASPTTSGVTWPNPVERLILNDDVTVEIKASVVVSKLGGDGSGKLNFCKDTCTYMYMYIRICTCLCMLVTE